MEIDVLIIGAGPTGLVAAIDAVRHGLWVRIVDQKARRSPHSKADKYVGFRGDPRSTGALRAYPEDMLAGAARGKAP